MQYIHYYSSPLGHLLLSADEKGLTGTWFEGQKYYAYQLDPAYTEKSLPVFVQADRWLDLYFSGKEPDFTLPLHVTGTVFQLAVWKILQRIPYGKTITYGEIAQQVAAQKGLLQMSPQAVGSAVGHNKLSVIIPCHRVVGKNGSLTGYAGGLDRKIKLLTLERADTKVFFIPKKGTAL